MNFPNPVKIKILRTNTPDVLVKMLDSDEILEINPNLLIRRIEEGRFELVETSKKSRSNTAAAPAS